MVNRRRSSRIFIQLKELHTRIVFVANRGKHKMPVVSDEYVVGVPKGFSAQRTRMAFRGIPTNVSNNW